MGSSISTPQTTTHPLINPSAKKNPKPKHVHPKFSLSECIFKINNAEVYRDVECKIIFKYVVNDEVYKDIRGKVIKDIITGCSHYTEWYPSKTKIKIIRLYSKPPLAILKKQ